MKKPLWRLNFLQVRQPFRRQLLNRTRNRHAINKIAAPGMAKSPIVAAGFKMEPQCAKIRGGVIHIVTTIKTAPPGLVYHHSSEAASTLQNFSTFQSYTCLRTKLQFACKGFSRRGGRPFGDFQFLSSFQSGQDRFQRFRIRGLRKQNMLLKPG